MGSDRAGRRWGSFPTTADVGLRASGRTPEELFEALALGLFALVTDLRTVRPAETREVRAEGHDAATLVASFLNALLVLHDTEGFVVREARARLAGDPPVRVTATLRGEPIDPERHPRGFEVKAVTLHRLRVSWDPPRARVILDI